MRAGDRSLHPRRRVLTGTRISDRLKLAVAGLASGIACGIAGAISVCALGGMVLPKLDPDFSHLASADLFLHISLGAALAGVVTGLAGCRPFRVFSGLALAGPLSLLFGIGGLFVGAFGGPVIRLALVGLGYDVGWGGHVVEHDILVGCESGMIVGALSAVRLLLWPPAWTLWAR
jgi:hypothetical protein